MHELVNVVTDHVDARYKHEDEKKENTLQARKDERKYSNNIRIFIFFNINNSFGVKYVHAADV